MLDFTLTKTLKLKALSWIMSWRKSMLAIMVRPLNHIIEIQAYSIFIECIVLNNSNAKHALMNHCLLC